MPRPSRWLHCAATACAWTTSTFAWTLSPLQCPRNTRRGVTATTTRWRAVGDPTSRVDDPPRTWTVDDPYHLPPIASTAKRIFYVRHGEVINPGAARQRSEYYGALDVPLSPLGQAEAQAAAAYLVQLDHTEIAAVYSSPLSRAVYGATQVCRLLHDTKGHTMALTQLDGLRELDRGAWAGLTINEIGSDTMARFNAGDDRVTPRDGESYRQLVDRVGAAVRDSILGDTPVGHAAVVVSHLQVTRCVVAEALGLPLTSLSSLGIDTASITCIDYDTDQTTRVLFQSFKPPTHLQASKDGAN